LSWRRTRGGWLSPVHDRYKPGDTATLVGYIGPGGTLGSVEHGPFFGYLRRLEDPLQVPNQLQMVPFMPQATDLPLGQLLLNDTGRSDYAAYRASLRFRLPTNLVAGRYGVRWRRRRYTIVPPGYSIPEMTNRIGRVVLVDHTWKVTRDTACADLALGGVTCPSR
jgi:hypothetical protein